MSISITLIRDESREDKVFDETTSGLDLFGHDRSIVAMKVNGEVRDLFTELADGDAIEPVAITSDDGLHVLRHSAGHVTAQAIQEYIPEAKLGIGPPITDGYYYDFELPRALTPDDLKEIEKIMQRIVKEKQRFVRRVVTEDQAHEELAQEPFKMELITRKGHANADDGSDVEVGGTELTIYDNVDKNGNTVWEDLCRGPHVPNTGYLGNGWALTRSSAAYWLGDQSKASLQRVYGTAWGSKDDLQAYKNRIAEAEKRDHRRIGAEMDLFSFNDLVGPGLPLIHPKGGIIKREMEDYVRQRHIEEGFQYVSTAHISKEDLFYTSGHLPYYAEGMFPAMHDDEIDAEGNVVKQGAAYRLKAMNCPMHNLIFSSRGRSYRELPLRLFEFGTVYRNEKSGVVQGLTRVRMITQDDSHSYCTKEQAPDEIKHLLNFILGLLDDFGMNDYYLEVSTRDEDGKKKDKFIGTDEQWAEATSILQKIADESGLRVVADPGGAAFYGPKISIQAKDAIGRTWQMSTIQYDFNQPERFGLEYVAADGSHQRPIMIHSAKFGSIERFMGVLIEHYAGQFPAWLAPVQVTAIPVADEHKEHLGKVVAQLEAQGIRVEIDESDDRFGKKIRNAAKQKAPFIMIVGGDDMAADAVSFRYRDGSQRNQVPVAEAVADVIGWIASHRNDSPNAETWK